MSDFASAIDDSFGAVSWPENPKGAASGNERTSARDGPREGNWEVSSSIGSFIDDRCPTVYGDPSARAAPGHVNPIGKALAHRLMTAAVEEKQAAAAKSPQADAADTPPSVHEISPATTRDEVKKPKPFILPRLREAPKKPEVPIPKTRGAEAKPAPIQHTRGETAIATEHKTRSADHPPKKPVKLPSRSVSVASRQSASDKRLVRLLGKNGEEAFVQLPVRPAATRKASSAMGSVVRSNSGPVAASPVLEEKRAVPIRVMDDKQKHKSRTKQEPEQKAIKRQTEETDQEPQSKNCHTSEEKSVGKRPNTRRESTGGSPKQVIKEDRTASTFVSCGKPVSASSVIQSASDVPSKLSTKATSVASIPRDSGIFIGSVKTAASHSTAESITPEVISIAQKISKLASSNHSAGAFPPIQEWSEQPAKAASSRSISVRGLDFAPSNPSSPALKGQSTFPQNASCVSKHSSAPAHVSESRHNSTRTSYKPPSVRTAKSSSSVEHQFDGFQEIASSNNSRDEGSEHTARTLGTELNLRSRHDSPAASSVVTWGRKQSGADQVPVPVRQLSPASTKSRSSSALPSTQHTLQTAPKPSAAPDCAPVLKNAGSQTNFAGTGWISPHPLSPVPRASVIQLHRKGSAGSSEMITYEEWQAERDEIETVHGSMGTFSPSVAASRLTAQAFDRSTERLRVTMKSDQGSLASHSQHTTTQPMDLDDGRWASPGPQVSVHSARQSSHQHQQQASVRSYATGRSHGTFSVTHHATSPQINRDILTQVDGPTSNSSIYNVGFTQNELDGFQNRLEDTVSRHSARFSQVQRMQSPPQPDYSAWDRRQSRSPRPPYQSSAQAHSLSVPPDQNESVQLPMPWDVPASVVASQQGTPRARSMASSNPIPFLHSSHTARSGSAHMGHSPRTVLPLPRGFSDTSRHASPAGAAVPAAWDSRTDSHVSQPDQAPPSRHESLVSQQVPFATESEATFGTREWQNLEDAEEGFGGFQSRQGW